MGSVLDSNFRMISSGARILVLNIMNGKAGIGQIINIPSIVDLSLLI